MALRIRHADVVTPDRLLRKQEVIVEQDRIVAIRPVETAGDAPGDDVIDVRGLTLTPGWIDVQINGGFGFDFTEDPGSIWEVAAQLPSLGVTAFLPTIITSPPETIETAIETVRAGPPAGWQGASPLGLHLEGPFLNPGKTGAHNWAYVGQPNVNTVRTWRPENGVRMVTLAPELPGACELIRVLRSRGVVVAAGHSMATFDQAGAGFDAGITYGTHLFNAMPALNHREPGLAGAALVADDVTVGVIADGVHVHPAMIKLAWRYKGKHRLTLVTDAMAALGMPPGKYRLGDADVTVYENFARLSDGKLAGSIVTPSAALRNLQRFSGCRLVDALATLTTTPADVLGLSRKGRIAPGYDADLTVITPDGEVVMTFVAGDLAFCRSTEAARHCATG